MPWHRMESFDDAHGPSNTVFTPSRYSLRRRLGSPEAPHRRLSIKGRHRQLTEDLFVTLSPRCEVPMFSPLNTAQRILLHSQLVVLSVCEGASSIVVTTYSVHLPGCCQRLVTGDGQRITVDKKVLPARIRRLAVVFGPARGTRHNLP